MNQFLLLKIFIFCFFLESAFPIPKILKEVLNKSYDYQSALNKKEYYTGEKAFFSNQVKKGDYNISGKPILLHLQQGHFLKNQEKKIQEITDAFGSLTFAFNVGKKEGTYMASAYFLNSKHGYTEHANFTPYMVISKWKLWIQVLILMSMMIFFYFKEIKNHSIEKSVHFFFLSPFLVKVKGKKKKYKLNALFWIQISYGIVFLTFLAFYLAFYSNLYLVLSLFFIYTFFFKNSKVDTSFFIYSFFITFSWFILKNYGQTFLFSSFFSHPIFIVLLSFLIMCFPSPLFFIPLSVLLIFLTSFTPINILYIVLFSVFTFIIHCFLTSNTFKQINNLLPKKKK